MEIYQNLNGDSGVFSFHISYESVTVEFRTGGTYIYNYHRPGSAHVEQMKMLARQGKGLNGYINKYIGKNYAIKQN